MTAGPRDPNRPGCACPLCNEVVILGVHDIASIRFGGLVAHRECALRSVLGGIGHLQDHAYWCLERHDPDGGWTPRQSALRVDEWVAAHGISAAVAISP